MDIKVLHIRPILRAEGETTMRSGPDLIRELDHEAKNHWYAAMVLGFEASTSFVWSKDKNRLATLNSAIQAGGTPVGLITVDKLGNEFVMRTRIYPEHWHSQDFDAGAYLAALTNQIKETLHSLAQASEGSNAQRENHPEDRCGPTSATPTARPLKPH
jgi:hypothetical protein